MKKVAVVILNWNGRKLLEEFLPSVVNFTNTEIADIIIADNNSTDDSLEFLSSYYPTLEVIALPQNYGYADGYNKTLKLLNHEYYVLLNSDVEVTANWLDPLYQYIEQHTDVAAIQPKVLAQRNKSCFEYAGAAGGFIDKLGYPFCRGRIFNQVEKDTDQYNTPLEIFWATGAYSSGHRITGMPEDWMLHFLHIWKRSIFAGGSMPEDENWYVCRNQQYIMLEVLHYRKKVQEKHSSISEIIY